MAIVVINPLSLPERTIPIPGAKPPLQSLPYMDDPGRPEEVDTFRELIRKIRRES